MISSGEGAGAATVPLLNLQIKHRDTMTTTEQNPAREEYFCQLINKAESHIYNKVWLEIDKANLDKEDILSITYDPNVALQKRVEELEGVILCLFDEKVSVEDSKQIAIKAMKSITVNKQP